MNPSKIRQELGKLKEAESALLYKFATEGNHIDPRQLQYVSKKIFEISDLILRLEEALAETKDER